MPWSIAAPVIGAVASSALSSSNQSSNGGAGGGTSSKEPWANAAPWLTSNLVTGQNLQNAYAAQPFSALQNQAYTNQNNQSAYMHGLIPSLLGQVSTQQVGFDRSNPNARPTAYNFGTADAAGQKAVADSQRQGGLLSLLSSSNTGGNLNLNAQAPQAAQPTSTAGDFVNQSDVLNGMNYTGLGGANGGLTGAGGYGSFKYGQAMPSPGTQAYRDMSAYFANGGADPNNLYGRGQPAQVAGQFGLDNNGLGVAGMPNTWMYGQGNSGNSVGGSPSGDGSGGGNPGAY